MNKSTIMIAIATLLSGLLIVFNEWLKRCCDNRHKKKKFKLWQEIYNNGIKGKEFSQPDFLLYELIEDGLVEIEISVGSEGSIVYAYTKGLKPKV